jgi:hypothetical protein
MSSSNPTAPRSVNGTTTEQRERYMQAVASLAAKYVREDGDSHDEAIDTAFGVVNPAEYFPSTMARTVAQVVANETELAEVGRRVQTLLTLGRPMDDVPSHHEMPNGATVADWLGTAQTATSVAQLLMERVRNGVSTMPHETLAEAEAQLTQALHEVRAVRAEVQS